MTPEQAKEVAMHLKAVHLIILAAGQVKGGEWDFVGWTSDDRKVRHRFNLDGYEMLGTKVETERTEREAGKVV